MFINRKFQKVFLSSGFSIMELMISVGIMGILALGVTSVMKKQSAVTKSSEAQFDTTIHMNAIQMRLFQENPAICNGVFSQKTETNNIINTAEALAGGLTQVGSFGSGVNFVGLRFDNPRLEGTMGAGLKLMSYDLTLILDQTSSVNESVVRVERKFGFPILLKVRASGEILECADRSDYLADRLQDEFCRSLGGTTDSSDPEDIECHFDTRGDATYNAQTLSGLFSVVDAANIWSGYYNSSDKLFVVKDDLDHDLVEVESIGVGGIVTLSNPGSEVNIRYEPGAAISTNQIAQSRQNFALSLCWLYRINCSGENRFNSQEAQARVALNPDGPVTNETCPEGSLGFAAGACSTSRVCPPGYFAIGVHSGESDDNIYERSETSAADLFEGGANRGDIACRKMVAEKTCELGQDAQLVVLDSGEITMECSSSSPTYSRYLCSTNGSWVLQDTNTCSGGATAGCSGGTSVSGDEVCCDASPGAICQGDPPTCGTGGGIPVSCLSDADCGRDATCEGEVIVSSGGACSGSFRGSSGDMFPLTNTSEVNPGGCKSASRTQTFTINTSDFKVGNIYSVTLGRSFVEIVRSGDTPQSVVQKIANKVNAETWPERQLVTCAIGNPAWPPRAVTSSNRISITLDWQHQFGSQGIGSCRDFNETACSSASGCSWTTGNICTGGTYTVPSGSCYGSYTYSAQGCSDGGFSSGSGGGGGCQYQSSQSSCESAGCLWGPINETRTCYGGTRSQCLANSGCRWHDHGDEPKNCEMTYESMCTSANNCSWEAATSGSPTPGTCQATTCSAPTSTQYTCDGSAGLWELGLACTDAPSSLCTSGMATNGTSICCPDLGGAPQSTCRRIGGGSGPGGSGDGTMSMCTCFVEGTKITMANGEDKEIQDLIAGESVQTLKISQGLEGDRTQTKSTIKTTMSFINHGYKYGINWKLENGRKTFVTGGHPFMTIDGSWKAFEPELTPEREREELGITKLDLGDIVVRSDGLEAIIAYHKERTSERVYNIEVNDTHEYIANGYRVHNKYAPASCMSGSYAGSCTGGVGCGQGPGCPLGSTNCVGNGAYFCSSSSSPNCAVNWCYAGNNTCICSRTSDYAYGYSDDTCLNQGLSKPTGAACSSRPTCN